MPRSIRAELEGDLVKLEKQKLQSASLEEVGDQVKEFCARAAEMLNEFSFDDKRLVLNALQVQAVVGKSAVKLFGVIPSFKATIVRTLA